MDSKDAVVFVSAAVSVSALVLQILNARYQRGRDRSGDLDKLKAAVNEMQIGYAVLRAQADIYWSRTTKSTAQELISPHTPELDVMLKELAADKLPVKSEMDFRRRRARWWFRRLQDPRRRRAVSKSVSVHN